MNIPNIPKEIHVNPNRSLQIMANQPDTLQKNDKFLAGERR